MLECVPDGKFDYKPHEKSMTLGHLASHMARDPVLRDRARFAWNGWISPARKAVRATTRKELLDAFDKHVVRSP